MLLTIVNRGLIALEGGLVNPFQAFLLIDGKQFDSSRGSVPFLV